MKQRNNAASWGRLHNRQRSIRPFDGTLPAAEKDSLLPFGNGRSYGDSCHNDSGTLLHSATHNKLIRFDASTGLLHAQGGILLADILTALKGSGWFLPVVPGTRFITLGGAIANDIHGKNHHRRGTFGRHVQSLALVTSNGKTITCTPTQNQSLFCATIGGMGLTGLVADAKISLLPVPSHQIKQRKLPFASIDEFITLSEQVEPDHEYSVAWCDSLATGRSLGKGLFMYGDHVESKKVPSYSPAKFNIPLTPPVPLVSGLPLRLFNLAYYHANARQGKPAITRPDSFFFPLDAIGSWNRLYGPQGLYQHQSVLPPDTGRDALKALIRASQLAGHGSFLTVLKRFGDLPSPGILSFPRPGFTLTLDFPARGQKTLQLLDQLDAITLEAGGRINPYKDARMSAETFQQGFPNWKRLEEQRDPVMMSDLWRRVTFRKQVSSPPLETRLEDHININQNSLSDAHNPAGNDSI